MSSNPRQGRGKGQAPPPPASPRVHKPRHCQPRSWGIGRRRHDGSLTPFLAPHGESSNVQPRLGFSGDQPQPGAPGVASYRPGNCSRTRVKDQTAAGRGRGTEPYASFSLSPRTSRLQAPHAPGAHTEDSAPSTAQTPQTACHPAPRARALQLIPSPPIRASPGMRRRHSPLGPHAKGRGIGAQQEGDKGGNSKVRLIPRQPLQFARPVPPLPRPPREGGSLCPGGGTPLLISALTCIRYFPPGFLKLSSHPQ